MTEFLLKNKLESCFLADQLSSGETREQKFEHGLMTLLRKFSNSHDSLFKDIVEDIAYLLRNRLKYK